MAHVESWLFIEFQGFWAIGLPFLGGPGRGGGRARGNFFLAFGAANCQVGLACMWLAACRKKKKMQGEGQLGELLLHMLPF